MSEQLSRKAIDHEAEKPIRQLEEELKSMEQVTVDGLPTKITPIGTYAYALTFDKGIPREKQSLDPQKPSFDVPTMLEYMENASEFIVKAQEEGLQRGKRNELTKFYYDSKPSIEALAHITREFIKLYNAGQDTNGAYEEILRLSKDIYEQVIKGQRLYRQLREMWESSTGKKWDYKALDVPFPYKPNKAEYISQYLLD